MSKPKPKLNLNPNQAVLIGSFIANKYKVGYAALDLNCGSQNLSLSLPRITKKLPADFFIMDEAVNQWARRVQGVTPKYQGLADHYVDLFYNYLACNTERSRLDNG